MPNFQLVDEKTGRIASLTELGELRVAPYAYSEAYYASVNIVNTAFMLVPAKAGFRFVITDMLISSDKNFGKAHAAETITIYEANAADLTTSLKTITRVDLLKNDRMPVTGLHLIATKARALVAIATDTSVDVTLAGYYIPV